MTKVHYNASHDGIEESYSERAMCGVKVGENYDFHYDWRYVTCKLCLRNRDKIESAVRVEEESIVDQLGDMADFFKKY